ncbi:LytTR family DNA-binding domain-containing protein [Peptostreptococcus anaerobius]|jgi:DNA-binding LytR/AlgR family response regulator|uniref:LytTR family DNA-binding domain-containing protein n=1 Tax=Peptostreptococcus anaerobius TaxID=1261 RepID=UPI00232F53FF|nr:LytTR family DNA-binding domain-containing protein [Peptostreptococcus anaerobius]MDB8850242.1 LytTR family DNA-binding domain-containing protein [Peptostreptococcus anaerobius]MDB8853911.1 LytTR family DNA-binding domain-containing protein [Peptostreptococcus anaerobius]MDB8855635.1 LytTR family DNA-binding domain-containing protein [Peptostreptococcus anaerobius]
MKVDIIIDETLEETQVKIFAKGYSKEVETIKDLLADRIIDKIVAFRDKEVFILSHEEIIRIFAQDKRVFIKTKNGTFSSRLTVSELENRLGKKKFIKISRSDIVNLDFVKKLDLSFTGTIAVELTNGDVAYVSRRNLKEFRRVLGL